MGLAVSWAMPNGTQIFSNVVAWIAGAGLLAALAIGLGVPRHSQAMLEIGEPGMLEGPAVAMLEIGEPGMLEGPPITA